MITVTLFSRADCHLCEEAKANLEALNQEIPHQLKVVDVDSKPEYQRTYGFNVPVVEVGPYVLKAPFSYQDVKIALGAAQQRLAHIEQLEDAIQRGVVGPGVKWTKSDRFSLWLARHYLALFNLFVLIYVGVPFLAPVLMRVGATGPAKVIYRAYGTVCHQLAYRSWFLFGAKPAYPRAAAGVKELLTFKQAIGLSEGDTSEERDSARVYIGDARVGYKVALCQRDVAIYGGILIFGILFALTRRRLPPFPWYLWVVIGLIPIAIDGFSQVISQPPIALLPYRESTPFLRTLTGGLFGLCTAWFGYPMVEATMKETKEVMDAKFRRINR